MRSSTATGSSSLAKRGPATQEGKEVVKWNATWHPLSGTGRSWGGEERRLGGAP
jgi:hypothetical protein